MLLATLLLVACGSTTQQINKYVTVETLYMSGQCDINESDAYIVDSAAGLQSIYKPNAIQQRIKLGKINNQAALKQPSGVDWQQERVVVIAMGQRPSTGYSVSLATTNATVKNGRLFIDILWQTPQQSSIQAQLITSPCLLIKVPASGYQSLVIKDQNNPPEQRWSFFI